ncbi:MAG TPA: alpha/beta hydrolase [Thermoanaerobaculia bacterium]|nr:alpha/beta hydrolase [Thermoanaerobaculia bacterium]
MKQEFERAQEQVLRRYGVDAESRFFEVPAVSGPVHALVSGEGPPLVMIPGFADPAAMWAPLMGALRGFTLYAVDRPSFGLTGSAPLDTRSFRKLAVDFLEQVLDALGLERPLVVGSSMGSLWTTWFALEHADRVPALVHVGCPAFILGTSAPLPMRLISIRPFGRLVMKLSPPSPSGVESFARAMAGEDLSKMPEIRDLLVEAQRLPGVQNAIVDLLHTVVRVRGARPEIALTKEQLAAIRQPVLLIWGESDRFGGADVAREAARTIPDCELHLIAGAGHIPWFAHADEVADGVQGFWSRLRSG